MIVAAIAAGVLTGSVPGESAAQKLPEAQPPSDGDVAAIQELQRIDTVFRRALSASGIDRLTLYALVVQKADEFVARYPAAAPALRARALAYQGESHYWVGQREAGIRSYRRGAALIPPLLNVEQSRLAWVLFRLGIMLREAGDLAAATAEVEAGLRLRPEDTYFQILLGELLAERGERSQAIKHLRKLTESSLASNEERAVVAMKLDRLVAGRVGASVQPPDMRTAPFYHGVSIGLVPMNDVPSVLSLADICVVLESKWLIPCEVLPRLWVPEGEILDKERNQYDGERVIGALNRRFPPATRQHRYLVAVNSKDLFGQNTTSVFSWQRLNPVDGHGTGVISTNGFVGLDDFYERDAVLNRRLAIQALSTTAFLLGFTAPTDPECPNAIPRGLHGFQQKRAKLCDSLREERDRLLGARGGTRDVFGETRSEAVGRVYRAYYLE